MNEIRLQPKQEEFISSNADICIGGGAAGGGKSYALTVEPLRHVGVKGFNFTAIMVKDYSLHLNIYMIVIIISIHFNCLFTLTFLNY